MHAFVTDQEGVWTGPDTLNYKNWAKKNYKTKKTPKMSSMNQ